MAEQASLDEAAEAALEQDVNPEALTGEEEPVGAETRAEPGEEDVVDAEIVEPKAELAVIEREEQALAVHDRGALTLFGTDDPAEVVVRATQIADALSTVIRRQGLAVTISNREYVKVEGWTFLGTMLGVFPITEWTRKIDGTDGGWEARVEARTKSGFVVGAAEAQCLRGERQWKTRDDFALRSMAATRATSKALRLPLGFVMALAGFEATPADEMGATAAPAEPEPEVETAPVAVLDSLKAELKMLKGRAGWGENEVLTAARKSFDRKIAKLTDLTQPEAEQIIAAAQQARQS